MGRPINGRRRLLLLLLAAVDSVTAQPAAEKGGPGYFNPKNFNPSMAIAMVVLVTAFFLLGFFSIYLRRCASPPLGRGGPDDADDHHFPLHLGLPGLGLTTYASSRSRRTTRGLDRAVLESFPTMAYADVRAHKGGDRALECAVCLSEFDDGDTLRLLLPKCNHAFHADCIDAWLASHVTCPVCRSVLAPDALPAVVVPVPATDHEGQVAIIPPPVVVVPAPDAVAVADATDAGETAAEEEQRVRREEAAELLRIGSVKRALRTKSSSGHRPAAHLFPRSHTTGHSLAAAPPSHSPSTTTDSERYTLRLPEHVLREAVAASNLRRSASVHHQTGGGDGTATRRGFGGGVARAGRSVRLGNSGRWPNMSLLARTFSAARLPVWGSVRRGEADGDVLAKGAKFASDDDHGKVAAVEPQCDGGACSLAAPV